MRRSKKAPSWISLSMSVSFKWPTIMERWWNLFVCWLTSLGKYRETDSSIRLVLCYCTQADATEPALRSDPHQENRFHTFLELRCLSPGVRAMGRHLYSGWHFVSVIFIKALLSLIESGALLALNLCISWMWKVVSVDTWFVTKMTFFSACRRSRNLSIFTRQARQVLATFHGSDLLKILARLRALEGWLITSSCVRVTQKILS